MMKMFSVLCSLGNSASTPPPPPPVISTWSVWSFLPVFLFPFPLDPPQISVSSLCHSASKVFSNLFLLKIYLHLRISIFCLTSFKFGNVELGPFLCEIHVFLFIFLEKRWANAHAALSECEVCLLIGHGSCKHSAWALELWAYYSKAVSEQEDHSQWMHHVLRATSIAGSSGYSLTRGHLL